MPKISYCTYNPLEQPPAHEVICSILSYYGYFENYKKDLSLSNELTITQAVNYKINNLPNDCCIEHKLKILTAIAATNFVRDSDCVLMFRSLNVIRGTDLERFNPGAPFGPLLLAIVSRKIKLAVALIEAGANVFAQQYQKGVLHPEFDTQGTGNINIQKILKDKPFSLIELTPFNYLLDTDAPLCIKKSIFKKGLEAISTVEEIVTIPINKLNESGILTKNDCGILTAKINSELNSLSLNEAIKNELLDFLQKDNILIPEYKKLNRLTAIAQIILYIKKPYVQNQLKFSLCGPNVFFISLAIHSPNMFAEIALKLLNNMSVTYPIRLKLNSYIQYNCTNVALLLYQSLKNSNPALWVPYNPEGSTYLKDLTTPREMVTWLQNLGCTGICDMTRIQLPHWPPVAFYIWPYGLHNHTLHISRSFDEQLKLVALNNQDKQCNILLINSNALHDEPVSSKNSNIALLHYVLLKSIKTLDEKQVSISFYTFGLELNYIFNRDDLEKAWVGIISYKIPTTFRSKDPLLRNEEKTEKIQVKSRGLFFNTKTVTLGLSAVTAGLVIGHYYSARCCMKN